LDFTFPQVLLSSQMLEIFRERLAHKRFPSGGVTATKSLRLGAVLAMSKSVETSEILEDS